MYKHQRVVRCTTPRRGSQRGATCIVKLTRPSWPVLCDADLRCCILGRQVRLSAGHLCIFWVDVYLAGSSFVGSHRIMDSLTCKPIQQLDFQHEPFARLS